MSNPALAALQRFAAQHSDIPQADRIGIAFSGGADSTALLLAARAVWGKQRLIALHVNHGLQAGAPDFAVHCARFCAEQEVPYAEAQVEVDVARGQSVEEQARDARYLALADLARQQGCAVVLLAQHGLKPADARHYVLHPGGARVLEAYLTGFNLQDGDLRYSWQVLRDYGNMSSPTVLFVLERMLSDSSHVLQSGEYVIMGALGPGFSSELALLRG